jgi:hypothetical protein
MNQNIAVIGCFCLMVHGVTYPMHAIKSITIKKAIEWAAYDEKGVCRHHEKESMSIPGKRGTVIVKPYQHGLKKIFILGAPKNEISFFGNEVTYDNETRRLNIMRYSNITIPLQLKLIALTQYLRTGNVNRSGVGVYDCIVRDKNNKGGALCGFARFVRWPQEDWSMVTVCQRRSSQRCQEQPTPFSLQKNLKK